MSKRESVGIERQEGVQEVLTWKEKIDRGQESKRESRKRRETILREKRRQDST